MNYYLDTEFIEDFCYPIKSPFNFRKPKQLHYVDLISIGIVAEDGREYYAVNKEFDLQYVWNKYDEQLPDEMGDAPKRIYWLRENVLAPLYTELLQRLPGGDMKLYRNYIKLRKFSYRNLKTLIEMYGKTKDEIAAEIQYFTGGVNAPTGTGFDKVYLAASRRSNSERPPTFYGYYCDYDWVVFCSLFGRMLDLPKGYPMFCMDLKQDMENLGFDKEWKDKLVPGDNEHHALSDARWNKRLHETIKKFAEALYLHKQSLNLAKTTTDKNEDY